MSSNSNLRAAKKAKNDEFYTQITDIEKELLHYRKYFKDKVVFCNCDDPEKSNFWKYFELNFDFLGLKKLMSTHYDNQKQSYKLELIGDVNSDGKTNEHDIIKTPLKQNGDFRSDECIELLKEADIVVTNPPFSLMIPYMAQLIEYNKKFIIMGNMNAVICKEIFPLIRDRKIWPGVGFHLTLEFEVPDYYESKTKCRIENGKKYCIGPAISWYTNLEHSKRNEEMTLVKKYDPVKNPKYDNYYAFNVDKVVEIPVNEFIDIDIKEEELENWKSVYADLEVLSPAPNMKVRIHKPVWGVPITFLGKWNPDQFEIVGLGSASLGLEMGVKPFKPEHREYLKKVLKKGFIDGNLYYLDNNNHPEVPYARLLIRHKK